MRFLSSGALWLLLLSAIIIFFYLLKLKRQRRVVSSVFLWQRALEEIEANAPFKKLRRSLLLLLQLLILAALVFALSRPLLKIHALTSGSSIIVIDSTASMSAKDEDGRTRLEQAKQLARDMVDNLSGSDRAAIIESSSRVTVRSALTSDRAALRNALSEIQPTDTAGTLADALLLAEQLAKAERDASIIVISDGGTTSMASGELNAAQKSARTTAIRLVRVGRRANNVGIVAFNSRPNQATGKQELFASLANFSDTDRDVTVNLKVDGNVADVRTITVTANNHLAVVFDALPQKGGLAELSMQVDDDLAADNLAYAMLPDSRKLRVAVASDNPFLLQAVAVNPAIEARKLHSPGAATDSFDCVVTDGSIASETLAAGKPLLAINPADVAGYWQSAGQLDNPAITSLNQAHPVSAYLSFADLHIESAPKREVAAWLRPIAQSNNDGLLWAGEQNGRRIAMLGFDLAKSDLPLKVEFPILLANAISWLSGRDAVADDRAIRAGHPVAVRASANKTEITLPDGDTKEIELRDGAATFADTLQAGIYKVKDAPQFAVSLLNESESNTAPRDAIQTRNGEVTGQAEEFTAEREIWRWLLAVALAILAAEWWVYHRRITA
jgi:hypothetical protein